VPVRGQEHGVAVSAFVVDSGPGMGPSLHVHPYPEVFIVHEGQATFHEQRHGEAAHDGHQGAPNHLARRRRVAAAAPDVAARSGSFGAVVSDGSLHIRGEPLQQQGGQQKH
jgi:hypothetical protein